MECNYFLSHSFSLSKMPKKHYGIHLCNFDDNVLLFWEARSNIKNKRKQNKSLNLEFSRKHSTAPPNKQSHRSIYRYLYWIKFSGVVLQSKWQLWLFGCIISYFQKRCRLVRILDIHCNGGIDEDVISWNLFWNWYQFNEWCHPQNYCMLVKKYWGYSVWCWLYLITNLRTYLRIFTRYTYLYIWSTIFISSIMVARTESESERETVCVLKL